MIRVVSFLICIRMRHIVFARQRALFRHAVTTFFNPGSKGGGRKHKMLVKMTQKCVQMKKDCLFRLYRTEHPQNARNVRIDHSYSKVPLVHDRAVKCTDYISKVRRDTSPGCALTGLSDHPNEQQLGVSDYLNRESVYELFDDPFWGSNSSGDDANLSPSSKESSSGRKRYNDYNDDVASVSNTFVDQFANEIGGNLSQNCYVIRQQKRPRLRIRPIVKNEEDNRGSSGNSYSPDTMGSMSDYKVDTPASSVSERRPRIVMLPARDGVGRREVRPSVRLKEYFLEKETSSKTPAAATSSRPSTLMNLLLEPSRLSPSCKESISSQHLQRPPGRSRHANGQRKQSLPPPASASSPRYSIDYKGSGRFRLEPRHASVTSRSETKSSAAGRSAGRRSRSVLSRSNPYYARQSAPVFISGIGGAESTCNVPAKLSELSHVHDRGKRCLRCKLRRLRPHLVPPSRPSSPAAKVVTSSRSSRSSSISESSTSSLDDRSL